jgi:hypothetical protein
MRLTFLLLTLVLGTIAFPFEAKVFSLKKL